MRKIIVFISLLVIVGCGFKLRGPILWPMEYQNVYMEGYKSNDRHSFYHALKSFFPAHVNIVDSPSKSDVIIQVLSENQTTRTISGLAANRDTEEILTLITVVQVTEKDGKVILPATTLVRERDFTYNESNLLSKSTDFNNTTIILRKETAAMFIRRLEAAIKNMEEAKNQ